MQLLKNFQPGMPPIKLAIASEHKNQFYNPIAMNLCETQYWHA